MIDLLVISPGGRRKRPDLGPLPAAERYDGPHHRLVMSGVVALRAAGVRVAVQFLSPKWGLVGEAEPLLPYDLSLDAMGRQGAAVHLAALRLPERLAAAVGGAPLTALLLPGKYLQPLRILAGRGAGATRPLAEGGLGGAMLEERRPLGGGPEVPASQWPTGALPEATASQRLTGVLPEPPPGGRILAFVAPSERLEGLGVTTVPCNPALTSSLHVPNTALKGRLFQALAQGIALSPEPALSALRSDPTPASAWLLIDQGR